MKKGPSRELISALTYTSHRRDCLSAAFFSASAALSTKRIRNYLDNELNTYLQPLASASRPQPPSRHEFLRDGPSHPWLCRSFLVHEAVIDLQPLSSPWLH
ncbi:hypothetical protein AG1IA_04703 [Rhizoctonia solani AG-1 IA]|uniref:Uncharacterized protein n=1 Tax=Thanatephorus cucumeris (strain AG1-IA) TaxID=983506 RepID=L8WY52_THACA|nr:hypothetical protein AG1IA_04703 [Rhizoctonia solani AG-1 IA]